MNEILSVKNLTKKYRAEKKDFIAVNNISFALKEGEILGLLGPNGAGKTTTIQMLLGALTPTSGSIEYFQKDFFLNKSLILKSVSFASTYLSLPGSSSIYENLDIFGRLYGIEDQKRAHNIRKYLSLFNMWNYRDRKVRALSAGQLTRVMLAKAFMSDPKIVLLDEPTASLDPDVALEVRAFVLEQQRELKTSIIFTSHNMAEVEEVCDRVLVLKNGIIIADHTPEALAASVSQTTIRLMGVEQSKFQEFARDKFSYRFMAHELEILIDESNIADFFQALSRAEISYSQVSIDKPSLEDYFLQIART